MKANLQLRTLATEKGVYLWQIATELGVSEATLLRWLRVELPDEKREKVIAVIQTLVERGGDNDR